MLKMIFSAGDEVFLCNFLSSFTGEDVKSMKENVGRKAAFKMSFAIESLSKLFALDEMIFFLLVQIDFLQRQLIRNDRKKMRSSTAI